MPIYKYETRKGTRYRAVVNVGYVQQKKEGFLTLREARAWEARTRAQLEERRASGRLYIPSQPLSRIAKAWLSSIQVRPGTREYYEQGIRDALSTLDDMPAESLRPFDLQVALRKLPSKRRKKAYVSLRACLRWARKHGLVHSDPTEGMTPPRVEREERAALTREEALALLENAGSEENRLIILLGLLAGLRAGEVAALRWRDVSDGRIHVSRSMRKGVEGPTKTGRVRTVRIPKELYLMLLHRREATNAGEDELIFVSKNGKPLDASIIGKRVKRAAERAGIRHVHPHLLRHTYSSWLISAGCNVQVVREQMGHTSIRTTLDVYGHLLQDAWDGFQALAEEVFGSLTDGKSQ